jgi:hypothetical protein
MGEHSPGTFIGFEYPRANYYRLPNDWFEVWAWVRTQLETRDHKPTRLDGFVKWLEYLIKHSWGYLNFKVPVRLTVDEFQSGRRRSTDDGSRGDRIDLGTGMSTRTLVQVPQLLLDLGLIERLVEDRDKARVKHYYIPHLRALAEEACAPCSTSLEAFAGFDLPEANYFPVPFEWTNLTQSIHSAVEILAAEYLMRHTFGWRDPVRWLTPAELASVRRRLNLTCYDDGIGYPRDTVAAACEVLVQRGLLVWRSCRRDIGREEREYALRMRDIVVDRATGRWMDPAAAEAT